MSVVFIFVMNIVHENVHLVLGAEKLGSEKYKSKNSYRGRWLEQFDFHLFDDEQQLEISLWSRNYIVGRTVLDLSSYPRELTQKICKRFDDHPGELIFVLSISGTMESETISDLAMCKDNLLQQQVLTDRYKWYKTFERLKDIGHLTVKVYGATGLVSADIGGKSDPFCVLELDNARLQTQTEYKTLAPKWNKIFTFNIKDITSVLVITIFDEDRDHKVEFLGKVAIPLLRIKNEVKHWYVLKDKKMFNRAKGDKPQILLEMNAIWNPIRAIFRVLQPKEEKLAEQEPKFKRQIFLYNVGRLKDTIMDIIHMGRYINTCLDWENPIRSIIALFLWITCCLWAGLEILPVALVVIILKNWFVQWITGTSYTPFKQNLEDTSNVEDEDNMGIEHRKTIKQKLLAIQEVSQTVQNTIGDISSLAEKFKNTFNFTVPELTWLVTLFLLGAAIILRLVPLRVLLVFWGLWKFSKRAISPNSIPNNEIIDILSRVPDDENIAMYRELPCSTDVSACRKEMRKKSKII